MAADIQSVKCVAVGDGAVGKKYQTLKKGLESSNSYPNKEKGAFFGKICTTAIDIFSSENLFNLMKFVQLRISDYLVKSMSRGMVLIFKAWVPNTDVA